MKKSFIGFYVSADGKHYKRVHIYACSFARAYDEAKRQYLDSGMSLVDVIEDRVRVLKFDL